MLLKDIKKSNKALNNLRNNIASYINPCTIKDSLTMNLPYDY